MYNNGYNSSYDDEMFRADCKEFVEWINSGKKVTIVQHELNTKGAEYHRYISVWLIDGNRGHNGPQKCQNLIGALTYVKTVKDGSQFSVVNVDDLMWHVCKSLIKMGYDLHVSIDPGNRTPKEGWYSWDNIYDVVA